MAVVALGPAVVDLTGVRAGDKNEFTVTLSRDGTAVDLTGSTVTAQARKATTDMGTPALTAEVTVVSAAAGQLTVRWPGDAVRTLLGTAAKWSGVWDLQMQEGTGDPVTVCAGKFDVEQDVTR